MRHVRPLLLGLFFGAGCSETVVFDFPPTDLSAGTELIALENQAFAVELGAVWQPDQALPDGRGKVAALLYSGTPAANGLTVGRLSPSEPLGPPKTHAGAFELSIEDGVAGEWRVAAEVPEALINFQLRHKVSSLADGSGDTHSCVLIEGGRLSCWGGNGRGQIGSPELSAPRPIAIEGLSDVAQVSIGFNHTCARLDDGRLYCFGHNFFRQLGIDTISSKEPIPIEIAHAADLAQLSAGGNRTCVLDNSGRVRCWGTYYPPAAMPTPPEVINFPAGVSRISSGSFSVCAIVNGEVYCSGYSGAMNIPGGLCSPQNFDADPRPVQLPGRAVDLAAGHGSTCAVLESGDLYCWGCNTYGELGVTRACPIVPEDCSEEKGPVLVSSGIAAVDLGMTFGCARRTGGTVVCWGHNEFGQIGDGTPGAREYFLPTEVRDLSGVSEVRAYVSHACALESSGRVSCWGAGGQGRLGNGTESDRFTPVPVAF